MATIDSVRVAAVRGIIAGLGDLAWSCHRDGCSRNDVIHILDELEKYLASLAARDALSLARRHLVQGNDVQALFAVCDLPETDAAVGELAWSCCRHGCTREEVTDILDRLEEYLDGKSAHLPNDA